MFILDWCQWGEWSSNTHGCDKTVCGPQIPITRKRKGTDKHGQTCMPDDVEDVTCPLNECLGKPISHSIENVYAYHIISCFVVGIFVPLCFSLSFLVLYYYTILIGFNPLIYSMIISFFN